MSTEPGNEEMIESKWKSLLRHVQNIHHGHGEIFPSCMHTPLSDLDLRTIKWLKPDTEECDSLQKLVETKMLVNNIKRCSSHGQTSAVVGYHSLVNQFAPKTYHFSFNGMKSSNNFSTLMNNKCAAQHCSLLAAQHVHCSRLLTTSCLFSSGKSHLNNIASQNIFWASMSPETPPAERLLAFEQS